MGVRTAIGEYMTRSILFLALILTTTACYAGNNCADPLSDAKSNLSSFFGKTRVSWFWNNGYAADEAFAGIELSENLRYLDKNHSFASSCRAHSCTDKVAIVAECSGKPISIGILHGFTEDYVLTIYFSDENKDQYGRSVLERWAQEEVLGFKSSKVTIASIEYRSQSNKPLQPIGKD